MTDVAVIGGGPAGTTAALASLRAGRSVTLIALAQHGFRIGESVPPALRGILADLDITTAVEATRPLPSLGVASAWGGAHLTYHDYLYDGLGNGWHLNRSRFDQALLNAAGAAGVTVVPARCTGARQSTAGWSLTCVSADGHQRRVQAAHVIDATGRRAAFATGQGAKRRLIDRLVGVAAVVERSVGAPHPAHTVVEAAEHGWWYTAPLPGGQAIIALLSDSDIIRHRNWTDPRTWYTAMRRTRHVSAITAGDDPPSRMSVHAASSHLLRPGHGPGWTAIGDAAFAMDPLSSAGILTAMRAGLQTPQTISCDPAVRAARDDRLRKEFAAYLTARHRVYAQEQRWSGPFWNRRVIRSRGTPPTTRSGPPSRNAPIIAGPG